MQCVIGRSVKLAGVCVCRFLCVLVGCRQNTGTGAFSAWGAVGCGVTRRGMGP